MRLPCHTGDGRQHTPWGEFPIRLSPKPRGRHKTTKMSPLERSRRNFSADASLAVCTFPTEKSTSKFVRGGVLSHHSSHVQHVYTRIPGTRVCIVVYRCSFTRYIYTAAAARSNNNKKLLTCTYAHEGVRTVSTSGIGGGQYRLPRRLHLIAGPKRVTIRPTRHLQKKRTSLR